MSTVPMALSAQEADIAHSDPHAGHNMSSTDQADTEAEHDMSNLNGVEGNTDDQHADADNGSSGYGSENHSSHGESEVGINTPPYWTAISAFGAFNLLVIIVAGFLKNGNRQSIEVN
jgi:hypothetical protein